DTSDEALAWLGKADQAARYRALVEVTTKHEPALIDWIRQRPLTALERADDWERLLAVVTWMRLHPRPAIHLREVDLPGIHSKFIERHRRLLGELFDRVLAEEAVDTRWSGVAGFSARYGFLGKPTRIR